MKDQYQRLYRYKMLTGFLFVVSLFLVSGNISAQRFNFKKDSTNRVTINRGSRFTRTPFVTLQIAAYDVKRMKVSNNKDAREAYWIPYQPTVYGWKLEPKDGLQRVYVKFEDANGNEVETVMSEITLDTTPPQSPILKIDVEGNAMNDTTQLVDLKLGAVESEKRYYVMISNHRSFYRQRWQVAKELEKDWRLGSKNDGVKMVFAKYRDRAGNISDLVSDKVIVDTQGPVRPSISINNGEPFMNQQAPTLQLTLSAGGATKMMISENQDFEGAEWENLSRYKKWKLSEGDGKKTIYAKFQDNAGNTTEVVSADIDIDSTAPDEGSITINNGDQTSRHLDGIVELSLKAKGAKYMMISNIESFRGSRWIPYEDLVSDWRLVGPNGKKMVYVKFRDDAGNESEVYSDDIVLIR